MKKMTFTELRGKDNWSEAVIVFTKESFNKEYSEEARSYAVSSDNKYFNGNMNGSSLYGYCLDGTDDDVRLDRYLGNWIVEYCYITKTK